jgi:hypothetical protein
LQAWDFNCTDVAQVPAVEPASRQIGWLGRMGRSGVNVVQENRQMVAQGWIDRDCRVE